MPVDPTHSSPSALKPDQYTRLRAEAKAPYRGLRKVIYATAGASGAIGALIMVTRLIAGAEVGPILPNLGIQLAVLLGVVLLFRLESRS
ncbi:MAG: DUF3493 domain-containing protein [Cyanobacteria bacterium REEB459]|nr:DUF3493 domain-containing protein [Cyanobacteria bacterium REEB459]